MLINNLRAPFKQVCQQAQHFQTLVPKNGIHGRLENRVNTLFSSSHKGQSRSYEGHDSCHDTLLTEIGLVELGLGMGLTGAIICMNRFSSNEKTSIDPKDDQIRQLQKTVDELKSKIDKTS